MTEPVMSDPEVAEQLGLTPSATVGPYLSIGLSWPDGSSAVEDSFGPQRVITVSGTLYDGAGDAIPDGLIETWQADPDGRFDHPDDTRPGRGPGYPGFRGFGRCPTDPQGRWQVRTVKPGPVPDESGRGQAPHLDVSVFAGGLLDRVVTRIYFPDEEQANRADPVLASIDPDRRGRLIATATGPSTLTFDIHLQGTAETPFFQL